MKRVQQGQRLGGMEVEAEISRWLKTEVKKARAGTEAGEKHWICNPRPEGLSQSFSFSLWKNLACNGTQIQICRLSWLPGNCRFHS